MAKPTRLSVPDLIKQYDQVMNEVVIRVEQLEKFQKSLSTIDLMNFRALIGLPKALEVIDKLDEGEYKEMAMFVVLFTKPIQDGVHSANSSKAQDYVEPTNHASTSGDESLQ